LSTFIYVTLRHNNIHCDIVLPLLLGANFRLAQLTPLIDYGMSHACLSVCVGVRLVHKVARTKGGSNVLSMGPTFIWDVRVSWNRRLIWNTPSLATLEREKLFLVGPVSAMVRWARLIERSLVRNPGLDSDHILSPITINWFAGVSIM
jgi:hypothetical protein